MQYTRGSCPAFHPSLRNSSLKRSDLVPCEDRRLSSAAIEQRGRPAEASGFLRFCGQGSRRVQGQNGSNKNHRQSVWLGRLLPILSVPCTCSHSSASQLVHGSRRASLDLTHLGFPTTCRSPAVRTALHVPRLEMVAFSSMSLRKTLCKTS